MGALGRFVVLAAVLAGLLVAAQPASATTFCVPAFFPACPNNGSNIGAPDFAIAVTQDASDGQADTVMLDDFDYVAPLPIAMSGNDDLTVIGSGRDKSTISTSSSINAYVLRTNERNGLVTVKDLAIIAPASFPDSGGRGSALQSRGDVFENVDLISENPGSGGASSVIAGGSFTNVRVFGRNGGSIDRAFYANCSGSGPMVLEQVEIRSVGLAVGSNCPDVPVTVSRAHISGDGTPVSVSDGARISVANSVFESGEFSPISAYNSKAQNTEIALDHVTLVAVGDNTRPAISASVANQPSSTGNILIAVRNSIFAGFQTSWDLEAPTAPNRGNVALVFEYSNFPPNGVTLGDSAVATATGNIDASPGFVEINDYHLAPGSSAVDAGDPNAADPVLDFEGNGRPIDGDYDGVEIRDMGAYELNPPPLSCPTDPNVCLPKLSKVKFRFNSRKGGVLRVRTSKAARVLAVFRPVPQKPRVGPKRKVVKIARKAKKAGPLVIKLGKRKLKPGFYRLTIISTDSSGNVSNQISRKVRARR